jgi:hypothetical protein
MSDCNGTCCPGNYQCVNGLCQQCPSGQSPSNGCCIYGFAPSLNGVGFNGGDGNYQFFSPGPGGCQGIGNLNVTLTVTGAMSATVSEGPFFGTNPNCGPFNSNDGFTIQLNANSASADGLFMQFAFQVVDNQINGWVQYFDQFNDLVFNSGPTSLLPNNLASTMIPANFVLSIQLTTDASENVVKATFNVTDTNSGLDSTLPVDIPSVVSWFGLIQLPILAFQVDVVGPDDCLNSTFAPGAAGSITYGASNGLCVGGYSQPGLPAGCNLLNEVTLEVSNIIYSPVSPCCGSLINQQVMAP